MKVKELKASLYQYGDDNDVVIQVQLKNDLYPVSEYYEVDLIDFERSDDGPGTVFLMTPLEDL